MSKQLRLYVCVYMHPLPDRWMPSFTHLIHPQTHSINPNTQKKKQYDAITKSGIQIVERVPIPPELVPKDAAVEITAKARIYIWGLVYVCGCWILLWD